MPEKETENTIQQKRNIETQDQPNKRQKPENVNNNKQQTTTAINQIKKHSTKQGHQHTNTQNLGHGVDFFFFPVHAVRHTKNNTGKEKQKHETYKKTSPERNKGQKEHIPENQRTYLPGRS